MIKPAESTQQIGKESRLLQQQSKPLFQKVDPNPQPITSTE